ncbi:MAG: hypothetical protein EOO12_16000 [Chitinophagaceae bacterium]|nr:MAG: hypothetical protein EOO12_16000 [Chitinophagaceae bacterium]
MNEPEQHILTEYVEGNREVQEHIWNTERRRTRNRIWFIALAFLAADLLALGIAGHLTGPSLLASLLVPGLLLATGFWALANPLPAIVTVTVLVLAIFGYQFYLSGWGSLLSGLLVKGLLAGLLIAGWKSARDAEGARRQIGA